MNRGPRTGMRPADDRSFVEKATEGWGPDTPDWIIELARLADRYGLRGAGDRIGYSGTVLSNAINAKYGGDLGRVEKAVRGALMGAVVECPVLGEIGRHTCIATQRKPLSSANPKSVRLYFACRNGCPNANLNPKETTDA